MTCFIKDNLLQATAALFHKVSHEIGGQYPEIEQEHWKVDFGATTSADTPAVFDVIVMPNLHGDLLGHFAVQIAARVGSPAAPTSVNTERCSRRSRAASPAGRARTSPNPQD